jgi:hypothetical protein
MIALKRLISNAAAFTLAAGLLALPALGQVTPADPPGAQAQGPVFSTQQLEELVGPIALYPDDLLAIVLPSATYPLDLVKAQRFLEKRKSDPSLQPDPNLPEPVRNLLNYPDVVKKMSDELDWTQQLGEAVVSQQKDVIAAIQAFRRKTYSAGNLQTDEKTIIVQEKEVIKVVPADPQVIYVPQYQPSTVVVTQPAPPVNYYPTPYPVYYYPYPPAATFATGFFFGAATAWAFNWGSHDIDYDVDINRTDNININRNNSQYQAAAQQARAAGEQRQAQRQASAGDRQSQRQQASAQRPEQRQSWRSEKQPSQVRSGQIQPRVAERPGDQSAMRPPGQTGGDRRTPSTQPGATDRAQRAEARPSTQPTEHPQRPGAGERGQPAARPSAGGFERGGGDAFGGMGGGFDTARASQRGSESRGGGGQFAGTPRAGGGARGGLGGGGGRGGRR